VLVERADTIRPALRFAVCLDGATPAHLKTVVEPAAMPISSKHWSTQRTRSMSGTGSGQEEISARRLSILPPRTPRSSASADQFTISGVELSISWLAVRLTATNLVVTRR
jgi:hypothetical protein